MAVLLHILGGTDFFDDFLGDENAIFYGMGWETCVWDTWCAHKVALGDGSVFTPGPRQVHTFRYFSIKSSPHSSGTCIPKVHTAC